MSSQNGDDRSPVPSGENKIRVAIVGVGNCASSLVQGRYYYENAPEDSFVPGLMHVNLGGYHVRDIEFVAAFDVNANKVGTDPGEAIYAKPNNTIRFCDVPEVGVTVQRGPTMDGIGKYLRDVVPESPEPAVDVAAELKAAEVDVLVSYLPVGSEDATRWYAEQAIEAGVGFVNAIPVFIGREPSGRPGSLLPGCPSSVTTSRARSAPPSATAC